jgi:23S rRNA-intervening sequence protein
MTRITSYKQLRVYQAAMDAAMRIFQLSKRFPVEERYDHILAQLVLMIDRPEQWLITSRNRI